MDNLNRMHCPRRGMRRAMTLVELLVVVLLLGIVMGIAASAVKNGTKGKKLREASRQVNSFIAGAQARAIEIGRPVGIEIVRNANEPRAGLQVFMTETPAPYAGDTTNARFNVAAPVSLSSTENTVVLTDSNSGSAFSNDLIQIGDLVQLNFRGNWYPIRSYSKAALAPDPSPAPMAIQIVVPKNDSSYIYSNGDTVRYKINRQPLRSSVTPLQMPTDTCIDLAFSGMGLKGQHFHPLNKTNASRVGFTFNSRGGIDRINFVGGINQIDSVRPTGGVYLLIGRYDGLISVADNEIDASLSYGDRTGPGGLHDLLLAEENGDLEDPSNIGNPNSIWVSVNHLTGKITTSNNAFIDSTSAANNGGLMAEARRLSKEAYSITGRGGQ
jgi:prepilin-type N-terminal cleavage/methylation domain-containing protein